VQGGQLRMKVKGSWHPVGVYDFERGRSWGRSGCFTVLYVGGTDVRSFSARCPGALNLQRVRRMAQGRIGV